MADRALENAIKSAEAELAASRKYLVTLEADIEKATRDGRPRQVDRIGRMAARQRTAIGDQERKLARLEAARDA
jgi:hypothetical protein